MSDGTIRFTAKMKGDSEVIPLLNRDPQKIGRTLESLVKQEARGLAVELARNTRPWALNSSRARGTRSNQASSTCRGDALGMVVAVLQALVCTATPGIFDE